MSNQKVSKNLKIMVSLYDLGLKCCSYRSFSHDTIVIFLAHWIRISEILPWDSKSYLTHAILPRASSKVIM